MRPHPLRRSLRGVLLAGLCAAALAAPTPPSDRELGRQLFAEGDFPAAEAAFSRDIAANPPDATVLYNRALARFNQRKFLGAKADLDEFLKLAPGSADGLGFRANVNLLRGDAAGALADAEAVLEARPADPEALLLRGRARLALGRHDAAFGDFSELLGRDPRLTAALIGRGDVQLARGDAAGARADFARVVSLAPQDPDALYKLGLAHFRLLEFAPAIQSLELAARLSPESALVARALGAALYAQGDFAAASRQFERATNLDPANSAYARMMLFLARRRQPSAEPAPLPEPPAALAPAGEWPTMLLRYLRGEVTEDDLLLAAQNLTPAGARPGRWCEAHFYFGTMRLLEKDSRGARYALTQAIETDQSAFTEHTLARAELARLVDLPEPAKPRPTRRR